MSSRRMEGRMGRSPLNHGAHPSEHSAGPDGRIGDRRFESVRVGELVAVQGPSPVGLSEEFVTNDLTVVGSRLYFTARDPNLGKEPMVIDSTDDSISTIDVNPGNEGSFAGDYFLMGSKLYFQALEPSVGNELQILDTNDHSLQTIDVNDFPGHSSSPRPWYFPQWPNPARTASRPRRAPVDRRSSPCGSAHSYITLFGVAL